MSSNVLFERDANVQIPAAAPKDAEKPKTLDYHRQMLEERLRDGKANATYVSPSDTIMSPATQKLAAFKNKHMTKGSKPRSLFAQTTAKNANNTGSAQQNMFADIRQNENKS